MLDAGKCQFLLPYPFLVAISFLCHWCHLHWAGSSPAGPVPRHCPGGCSSWHHPGTKGSSGPPAPLLPITRNSTSRYWGEGFCTNELRTELHQLLSQRGEGERVFGGSVTSSAATAEIAPGKAAPLSGTNVTPGAQPPVNWLHLALAFLRPGPQFKPGQVHGVRPCSPEKGVLLW